MGEKKPKQSKPKVAILIFLLVAIIVIPALTVWNLNSAPRLRPVGDISADVSPLDYNASLDFSARPGSANPQPAPAQSLLPEAAQLASLSKVGPGGPTPTPILVSGPKPDFSAGKSAGGAKPGPTPAAPGLVPPRPGNPAATAGSSSNSTPNSASNQNPTAPASGASDQAQAANNSAFSTSANPARGAVFAPVSGQIVARGAELVDEQGARFFVSGVNYEGHTDRAWLMWQNDKWDPELIQQNFALAAAGGYNSVRIFVQTQLRDDILANYWVKLDKITEIARQNGLRLLITFNDYGDQNISRLMQIEEAVARHFAGNSTILGYDLRNEPQFSEIISAIYPAGQEPVLQSDEIIRAYGERISQAEVNANRGGLGVPGYLNARQAYIYANMMRYYNELQNDSAAWVSRAGRLTSLDYYNSPDSSKWQIFVNALDATVQRYIDLRQGAIFKADPNRLVTIGWNRVDLARLPANQSLGFVSLHRFPGEGAGGLAGTLSLLDHLKNQHSSKPVVLEEFGYSNVFNGQAIPLLQTASYETAIWLFLYGRGFAGGFKWMLHNFSIGANPYENNFGLTNDLTQPKPSFQAARSVHLLAAAMGTPSGDFGSLESTDGTNIRYSWGSGTSFFGNLKEFNDSRVQIKQSELAPWAVWWPSGQVLVSLTATGQVSLDVKAIFPDWPARTSPVLSLENGQVVPFEARGETGFTFTAQPGALYTIKAPVPTTAVSSAKPLNIPNNIYFHETGHNLSNVFRNYWDNNGGLALFGYPISEELQENGLTVQYFERARFEYHPENSGTGNDVQLGLLGMEATAGRKEAGEPPFQPVPAIPNTDNQVYFSQTGHSVKGGFKARWEALGGVSRFGYPISEEFPEVSPLDGKVYVVQYFERIRFEFHPEKANSPDAYQLGLLGLQSLKAQVEMLKRPN
jgi:hypothetical protein